MSQQQTGALVTMDFKLPLWGVISAAGGGFVMMVGMFFNVATLTQGVKDLQITVQAGNTAYSSLASRVTLLEFRMENHSEELRRIQTRNQKRDDSK